MILVGLAAVMVFGCSHIGSLNGDAGPDTDTDTDSDTDTDTDSDTGDEDIWECYDGPLDFEPKLYEEIDATWEPTGPFWKMEYLPVERMKILESPPLHDGAVVRILMETTVPNSCWRLTSTRTWAPSVNYPRVNFMALRALHLEQSDCPGSPHTARRIVSMYPNMGCWMVVDLIGGEQVSFDVVSCEGVEEDCECDEDVPWGGAPEGMTCAADCQCEGFSSGGYGNNCLPVSESERECGFPCSVDEDCWAGECFFQSDDGPGVCRYFTFDECSIDEDCPLAHICMEYEGIRFCRTNHELTGETRHECSSNYDCETPGLVCTLQNWPGGGGAGRCNLPCESKRTVCPEMHHCGSQSLYGSFTVCEWVGE